MLEIIKLFTYSSSSPLTPVTSSHVLKAASPRLLRWPRQEAVEGLRVTLSALPVHRPVPQHWFGGHYIFILFAFFWKLIKCLKKMQDTVVSVYFHTLLSHNEHEL